MPFAPHIRMTVAGSFKAALVDLPYEIWQFGLALAVPGGGSLPQTGGTANAALWADMAADAETYLRDPGLSISGGITLDYVKFATIQADGTYGSEPTIVALDGTYITAGQTISRPPQTALAVSLGTDAPLDRVKGRMYLPVISFPLQADGRLQASAAQDIATKTATFINVLNNQPGIDSFPGLAVCVASTKGQNWRVDDVRCGRVFDTIRSRRNAMNESYGASVPTG